MLANNNRRIISRMAKSSVRKNRGRNLIIVLAVALSAFMLFCIFTVGITYFQMQRTQNIRLNGGDYDAIMYGITEEQREKCESDPEIIREGILAMSGYIEATEADDTVELSCIWADETCWEEMMSPAREWVKGTYPSAENEVMVTEEALEDAGLEGLTVGDSFLADYRDGNGSLTTKEFTISGMWDGWGTRSAFYVSEAFYQASGFDISEARCGRYHLDFGSRIMTSREQVAFIESMNLGKQQALYFTGDMGYSLPIFFGLCALIFVTCLCAYLLIYNIMYLSVSGNVRYYGLLQTVGMTGRQIRALIRRQMLFLGGTGITGGILAGCVVAFLAIPSVIRALGIRTGVAGEIKVSLNPAVLILTILLAAFTIYMGSRKPARLASEISPVEAMGYRPSCTGKGRTWKVRGEMKAHGKRKTHRKTKTRGKNKIGKSRSGAPLVLRMAFDQFRKDKKKSAVIIVSMAAGMSVFLCISTLIESQGARTIVADHMNSDIVIQNDTMKKENLDEWRPIISDHFLSSLEELEGIHSVCPVVTGRTMVPWEPEFADLWMEEFYAKWMNTPYEDDVQEYREHPENFGAVILGISEEEFPYLQDTVDTELNKADFMAGKTCVLYRNGLDLTMEDLSGKEVTCAEYGNQENSRTFQIGGITDETYYTGTLLGYPPTIITSQSVVEDFIGDCYVSKAAVRYEEEFDKETENAVLDLIGSSPDAEDFSWTSKIESMEEVERAQGSMKEVGAGIALILAIIGILNYINTMTGNIQSRKTELAVLESIGMTDRQRNRMLILEGLFFAAASLLVTATAGLGVTFVVYQSMNYMQVPFVVPLWPTVGMAVSAVAVCAGIPAAAGAAMIREGSAVERLRGIRS